MSKNARNRAGFGKQPRSAARAIKAIFSRRKRDQMEERRDRADEKRHLEKVVGPKLDKAIEKEAAFSSGELYTRDLLHLSDKEARAWVRRRYKGVVRYHPQGKDGRGPWLKW
jgi:hypothetical protein